jgi:serine/threonine protein kinase
MERREIIMDSGVLIKKIGFGSFGDVYLAHDHESKYIAVKMEKISTKKSRLKQEFKMYKIIKQSGFSKGLPEVYCYMQTDEYNIMTMELLGANLNTLMIKNNGSFDLSTVLKLGIDIIALLEKFHSAGFIHRDIKPNNFLVGQENNKHIVHIMDLGLSKKYIQKNGSHMQLRSDKSLVGTARYTSVNVHMGIEPSRRDDLESVGYMLVYFLLGSLPWQGLKKDKNVSQIEKIGQVKIHTNIKKMCKDIEPCFAEYIDYCRNLGFESSPDYDFLKSLFLKTAEEHKLKLKYCWCHK